MSIRTKFFLSSVVMLVLPIFLMLLITAFILALGASLFPNITIEVNGGVPSLENPMFRKYVMMWILIMIAVVSLCCVGVTAYLSRGILTPLKKMSAAMEHLAEGDLDYEFTCTGDMEIREVYDSMERLRIRLKQAVRDGIERNRQSKLLIANISHDLKTPITSIKGYVEGIRDGIASSPEMIDKYLDTVQAKAETIEKMVDQLSLYSKLELEAAPYDMRSMNMCEFIGSVLEEYSIDLEKGDIDLSVCGIEEEIFIRFDGDKMKRVFSNIIENTIRYKRPAERGSLRVEITDSKDHALISFADIGIGIGENEESKVFETFFRGDPARNLNSTGNGLGLSICRKIIREHGGSIWMRANEPEPGVTVYIRLPKTNREQGMEL